MQPRQICIISKNHQAQLVQELRFLKAKLLETTAAALWVDDDRVEPAWAQCVWRDVQTLEFKSISDAQKQLRAISKKWNYFGDKLHRRGSLIAEELLPKTTSQKSLPAFTLLDSNLLAYSKQVGRPTADGKIEFKENKTVPPSRAYLKLWEAFAILGEKPSNKNSVLELGASPGSWTWAVAELGANIMSVDRSPLHENLSKYSNIQFVKGDAFSLKPKKTDWLLSDVICFPDKLYDYVQTWIASGLCDKFICTIKFTGDSDPAIIDRFRQLPNSRVLHLFHNKNEVTWISHPRLSDGGSR